MWASGGVGPYQKGPCHLQICRSELCGPVHVCVDKPHQWVSSTVTSRKFKLGVTICISTGLKVHCKDQISRLTAQICFIELKRIRMLSNATFGNSFGHMRDGMIAISYRSFVSWRLGLIFSHDPLNAFCALLAQPELILIRRLGCAQGGTTGRDLTCDHA